MQVEAIKSFDHGGKRKRGDRFEASTQHAEALRKRGLVVLLGEPSADNPSTAAGEKSSALPAAPASPKTTAKPSGRGGRRRKDAASS
ncbi:hypothetical protein [Xenophilus sp.]|uniref:hypothetical protein n=1 Tax=Xenophilus sp. TaxID=1873499 RepID=UPI0037DD26C1